MLFIVLTLEVYHIYFSMIKKTYSKDFGQLRYTTKVLKFSLPLGLVVLIITRLNSDVQVLNVYLEDIYISALCVNTVC